jgi:SAM-dependent methyltransferase
MTTSSSVKSLLADDVSLGALNIPIEQLRSKISADLTALPHLAGIKGYNDSNLAALTGQLTAPPHDARILDIGASIHGFVLDGADALGYGEYIGIDLDTMRQWGTNLLRVTNGDRSHLLCQMDAHRLWFADESMDAVLCLSGFEHYLFPELVLREIMRVLKKGGTALISYEPIWTCSYGHHLHHFGLGYAQVPPWSHLILTKTQMGELLERKEWPAGCAISKAEAVEWIYNGREINRRDYRFHQPVLSAISCTEMLWLLPHADPAEQAIAAVDYAASLLPYTRDELLTRGFSCCFRK